MKVSGTSTLQADRELVWQALNDPAVLVRAIPGCQRLEAAGDNEFRMTVAAGVGAIKGVYDGEVRLHDQQAPGSFRMHAHGAGAPGTIGADVLVTLETAAGGGTALTFDADATVGGMIGGVGQRMLVGVSKKMAAEFFGNVDTVLSSGGTAPTAGVPGTAPTAGMRETAPAAGVPGTAPAAGGQRALAGTRPEDQPGQVFTAPQARTAVSGEFALGAVVGAVAALAGAVVGGWLAGRRRS